MANWWLSFGSILFIALGLGILGWGIYSFVVPYMYEKNYKNMVISKGFTTDVDPSNKVTLDMKCPVGKKIYLSQAVITTVPANPSSSTEYESRTSSTYPGLFDPETTLCALDSLAPTVNGVNAYKGTPVLNCNSRNFKPAPNDKVVLIGVYDCIDDPSKLQTKADCKWWGYTSENTCKPSTKKTKKT